MRVTLLIPLLATAVAVQAQPQAWVDRPSDSQVLKPPPRVVVDRGVGFRSRYQAQKMPTMMLLWNRRFSDEVQSDYVDRTTVRSSGAAVGVSSQSTNGSAAEYGVSGRYRGENYAAGASASQSTTRGASFVAGASETEITSGRTRVREGQPGANLDAEDDAGVETTFTETLQANGVRFVDRSVSMRTAAGAKKVGGDANIQALETNALMARTSILIEVTQIPASDSPIGTKFRVSVKNLKTAAVLASFTSNGVPNMARPGLVAGPGGFQRAAPKRPGPSEIGAELASQVMERLAVNLR